MTYLILHWDLQVFPCLSRCKANLFRKKKSIPAIFFIEVASLTKTWKITEMLQGQNGISIHPPPPRALLEDIFRTQDVLKSVTPCVLLDEGRQDTYRPKWGQFQQVIFSCSKLSLKVLWYPHCDVNSTIPAYTPSPLHENMAHNWIH